MSDETVKHPTVFISYSWTTPEHEEWVLSLANRLMGNDGINVILDKWHLQEGQDKYVFMENSVKADETDKVLLICDKAYCEKANARAGGVGTETLIISKDIYEDVAQVKFIPVIAERDVDGKEFLPYYLETRMYIDLSNQVTFEENYDKLIRGIWGKPTHSPPKLAAPPKRIFESTDRYYKTTGELQIYKQALDSNSQSIMSKHEQFIESLLEELETFKITQIGASDPFDEVVFQNIQSLLPLRNDLIDFFELTAKFNFNDDGIVEQVVFLFEKLNDFTDNYGNASTYTEMDFDNFKFFTWEAFLLMTCFFMKRKRYKLLSNILEASYFMSVRYRSEKIDEKFGEFSHYSMPAIQKRNDRLNLRKYSLESEMLIINRPLYKYTKYDLLSADLILFYLGAGFYNTNWFCRTYVYKSEYSKIDFLQRLKSIRHFEKVKELFKVSTIEELKEKAQSINYDYVGYRSVFDRGFPKFEHHINLDDIASIS